MFSKNVMAPCGVGFVLSGEPHVKPRNRIATSGKRSAQQLDSRSLTKRDLAKAQRIPCLSRVATLVQPTENGQSLYISVPNLGYGIALKAGTQALAMCWGSESCGCRGSRTLPAGGPQPPGSSFAFGRLHLVDLFCFLHRGLYMCAPAILDD